MVLTFCLSLLVVFAAGAPSAMAIPHRLLAEEGAGEAPPATSEPTPTQGHGERHARHGAGCRLTMSLASPYLLAGEQLAIVGSLACSDEAEDGEETVSVFEREAGTSGFTEVGTATTEADGAYQFTTLPLSSNSTFYVTAGGTHSPHRLVRVAAGVSISGPPTGTPLLAAGHRFAAAARNSAAATFTGTVSPDDAGARVILQRERAGSNEEWRRIGLGEVASDGTYSISHTFAIPGSVNIRVVVRARGHNLTGASEPISYEIAQRQNPRLTIEASAAPLSYGQPVTISGVAPGANDESLTLTARGRKGSFETTATTTTDGEGNYSFGAQTPTHSTVYEVFAGRTHSRSLLEAVSPQLTAEASASSVVAGTPLTFKGTVAPDHSGRRVYLERQASSGIGFQVVAVATIGPESTYTLEHTIFTAGPQVFRVKVPAADESPPVASAPIDVQVTGTSAGALQAKLPAAESSASGSARL